MTLAPPSNGKRIVLESESIRPTASSSSNEQRGRDQMVNIAALDSHGSHTIAWPNSLTHVHIEPISGWCEITPAGALHLSLTRRISTHMSNGMIRVSTSMQRMVSRLTATSTANTTSLSISRKLSAISLPYSC